jgi:tRNA-modifying protein YgfZ
MEMAQLQRSDIDQGYLALVQAVGLVELDRTQIELTGADRAAFLHNFCTNSVRDIPPGGGREAFVLDAKGHVLGHVLLFVTPHSIVLDAVAGQTERLIAHFERYVIREDVSVRDRTAEWADLLIGGPQADDLLDSLALHAPLEPLAHTEAAFRGNRLFIRRVDLVGPESFLIACERRAAVEIVAALANAGAVRAGFAAFEAARIESGTPVFGQDITEKNLPQEVNRDAQAISLNKGCYLGQETVARIDALGHVNKVLCGVRFYGKELPASGSELTAEGGAVGTVTSATYSPRLEAPLALAYVRSSQTARGTKLSSQAGPAEVVALPL